MSAATILALVPANRYYCDVTCHAIMYVPSLIKIERGSDGSHDFKYYNMPPFARKPGDINISMSAAPKLALVPASRYYCDIT